MTVDLYSQKNAAYRSVSPFYVKPRFGGVLLSEPVTRMNNCHDAIPKKNAAIGQFRIFYVKTPLGGVLLFE